MTRRLARLALRLYPLAFQRRYGEEMRALLEETPPRAVMVVDLLRGAMMAHLRPSAGPTGVVDPADRLRASASGVLTCWIVFAAVGLGFYKTTEDAGYSSAGHAHPLLGAAHLAVQGLAVVGSVAVVLGALPLVASAVAAARRRPRLRRSIVVALSPVIVFAGLTGLFVVAAHAHASGHPWGVLRIAFVVWALAGLGCAIVCAQASRAVLFAIPIAPARLMVALAGGTVVTLAMTAIAGAIAVYAIALWVDASPLAATANGPFQLVSTAASLVGQLILMAIVGALAITTTRRGWRVARQLQCAAPA